MKINDAEYRAMKSHWDEVFIVPPSKPTVSSTDREHYEIDDWWDDNIGQLCNWLSWGIHFDIVLVNYAYFSKCFDYLNDNFLKILDTHDVFAGRKEMLLANGLPVEFFYTTEEQERIALRRSSLVLAIKPSEAVHFRQLADTPVLELGHFEDTSANHRSRPRRDPSLTFGYLGSENPINQENMRRFLMEFGPALTANTALLKVRIAGLISNYAATLPEAHLDNVEILGPVDRVERFYEEMCDVVVSPFDFGTGLKIKTVEALNFGKPIIGTKHAFEGIPTTEYMHQFPTVRDMVAGCLELAASPEQKVPMLQAATVAVNDALRDKFHTATERILRAARCRRLLIFLAPEFWKEETPFQRRSSLMIRNLKEMVHVHIACPVAAEPEWASRLDAWQWGSSRHLNEDGIDPEGFIASTIDSVDPSVCIFQYPSRSAFTIECQDLYLDFNGGNAIEWVKLIETNGSSFTTPPSILYSSDQAYDAARSISGLNSIRAEPWPMVDFEICVRLGHSLAIVCDEPQAWAPLIDVIRKDLLLSTSWNGKIDVFEISPCEAPSWSNRATYGRVGGEIMPSVSHGFRACVHLGAPSLVAADFKAALLNQGVPILRLSDRFAATETFEVDCVSTTDLRQHIRLIFASDATADKYAASSNSHARFGQSKQGLTSWCRRLGHRLKERVSQCLRDLEEA